MVHHHEKRPVHIIGGFLGAGKTTLLNHILAQQKDPDCDVLVREYGTVAIDDQLVKGTLGRIHVFPGVSVHEDPQLVLYDYLHGLHGQYGFHRLLMEASGLDTPESLVHLFLVGHMPAHYQLGSYIVVVDGKYGILNLDEYPVAAEQIAYADVIVINKADLATETEMAALQKRIGRINAMAPVYRTSYGKVQAGLLLNISLYQQLKDLQPERAEGNMDGIHSIVLTESRPMSKEKVNAWLGRLFVENGVKLLRSKGFFQFAGDPYRYEFQGVRRSFHSKADRLWEADEERKSTVVLIGENLPEQKQLQESFQLCVEESEVSYAI